MSNYPPGCSGPPNDPPEYEQEECFLLTTRWLRLEGVQNAMRSKYPSRRNVGVDYADAPHTFWIWNTGTEDESLGDEMDLSVEIEEFIEEITRRSDLEETAIVETEEEMIDAGKFAERMRD